MRVLVCGSRDWGDYASIYARLSALPGEHEEITVIHGAARRRVWTPRGGFGPASERSADMLADRAARDLGFRVECFPADWNTHPRKAGILRNLAMLDTNPDLVIAFQRNNSRGTQHTIDEARKRGIPVEVHTA